MKTNIIPVQVLGERIPECKTVLTDEALAFLAELHRRFNPTREALLRDRQARQKRLDAGELPDFLESTRSVRAGSWTVAEAPADLQNRRIEITGPVDRKMMINALNSGANVFMADFEDSLSPAWANVVQGQVNCQDAVRRTLEFRSPEGKHYGLKASGLATLLVRPRGWHLRERHVLVDGEPISASLFDFGLYFFHNAHELIRRGSGPYFYLPKLESHLEARLWNDVFCFAQGQLGIPRGTIRATVLIETVLAAFEMHEILHELREHASGLNAGRWDYLFSFIKKLGARKEIVFPDRGSVTMAAPFMRAYARLLVDTCHARAAHAIGGMSAFVPNRKNPEVNATAIEQVTADKTREAADGFDGTWVAHPDLVPVAGAVFERVLGRRPHQKQVREPALAISREDLLDVRIPGTAITEVGVRSNISVTLQYLEAWLRGSGAVTINNLMEDAATAEISRSQLWQWVHRKVKLRDDGVLTESRYRALQQEELAKLAVPASARPHRLQDAARILEELVLSRTFPAFLTLSAERALDRQAAAGHDSEERSSVPTAGGRSTEEQELERTWKEDPRWRGIRRPYTAADVLRLRSSVMIEHTLARRGAEKLWGLLASEPYVAGLGALTGAQAVQMVKAGLRTIYLSGWQVAADANLAGQTYPDQSLYPSNSVPGLVRRLNAALMRADQIQRAEGKPAQDWYAPILADAEAGFGGPVHAFELMKGMIEAGAAAVHFEDQLAAEKKCGHMGGKVLIPTSQFIRTLVGARLAADVLGVPSLIVARTDSLSAAFLTSDVDPQDAAFLTGKRTPEGYYEVRCGMEAAIARALAYAPYADLIWFETSKPDLAEAERFAKAVHAAFPGKLLAYNCSPSFNWSQNLGAREIAGFQQTLGRLGYRYQFVTLAGWHALNLSTFRLARDYAARGMSAYVELQEEEFATERDGYTATRHQREVGAGYFDQVLMTITAGAASTTALRGSTESEQFEQHRPAA